MSTPTAPPADDPPQGDEPPADEILAGELVLGVLAEPQHRELQARRESDPAFSQRVDGWERRLAPLLTEIAPVQPPAHVWPAIRSRLGWSEREAHRGFWANAQVWRTATVLSVVIAIAALTFGLRQMRPPPPAAAAAQQHIEPGASPVTPLIRDDGTPGWLASINAALGTVLIVPVPTAPDPQGRVPELWLIPAGQAPRSLGAVSTNQADTVSVPTEARGALVAGSTLAITLEPAAGVPHAAPTGAIIAKGTVKPPAAAS